MMIGARIEKLSCRLRAEQMKRRRGRPLRAIRLQKNIPRHSRGIFIM
jgi:hypothetical protein